MLCLSALNFDLSVYDIFGILAAGGVLVMPEEKGLRDPAHWRALMLEHRITLWNTVPALKQMLVDYLEPRSELAPEDMRLVMMSGDWIPLDLPGRIRSLWPGIEIIGLGGATEASIWSNFYPIKDIDPDWKSIPYGTPLTNQSFQVLDSHLEPCPIWVPGNLCIGGIGLAKGYWNDPEKTQERFITHPRTGERLYKTGDLGRYLPDGNLEFLGRVDFQVKIRGFRIELGEIEAVLAQHPSVQQSVIIVWEEPHPDDKRLVAYFVPNAELAPTPGELRHFLGGKLPDYMVPAVFVLLESIPLTPNGKIDRRRLPTPDPFQRDMEQEFITPRTPIEKSLVDIWTEVLEHENIGIFDNFFDLGGHSLLIIRLQSELQSVFGKEIPAAELFEHPTIHALAQYLGEKPEKPITHNRADERCTRQTSARQQRQARQRHRSDRRRL